MGISTDKFEILFLHMDHVHQHYQQTGGESLLYIQTHLK